MVCSTVYTYISDEGPLTHLERDAIAVGPENQVRKSQGVSLCHRNSQSQKPENPTENDIVWFVYLLRLDGGYGKWKRMVPLNMNLSNEKQHKALFRDHAMKNQDWPNSYSKPVHCLKEKIPKKTRR